MCVRKWKTITFIILEIVHLLSWNNAIYKLYKTINKKKHICIFNFKQFFFLAYWNWAFYEKGNGKSAIMQKLEVFSISKQASITVCSTVIVAIPSFWTTTKNSSHPTISYCFKKKYPILIKTGFSIITYLY